MEPLGLTTGGTAPYRYQINGYDILNVTGLTYSFTNLFAGNYTAVVTDANLCTQTLPFTITNLGSLDFVLSSTNYISANGNLYTPTISSATHGASYLNSNGYNVTTCTDGLDGYIKVQQEEFDLIITDIMMEMMNGDEMIDGFPIRGVKYA
jgi:hypothetical protein